MRQQEIKQGIEIKTRDDQVAGKSSNAAISAVEQVVPSRCGRFDPYTYLKLLPAVVIAAMAAPAMVITPLAMSRLEKTATFIRNPWMKAPATVRSSVTR
jgi:hypothetical protein